MSATRVEKSRLKTQVINMKDPVRIAVRIFQWCTFLRPYFGFDSPLEAWIEVFRELRRLNKLHSAPAVAEVKKWYAHA